LFLALAFAGAAACHHDNGARTSPPDTSMSTSPGTSGAMQTNDPSMQSPNSTMGPNTPGASNEVGNPHGAAGPRTPGGTGTGTTGTGTTGTTGTGTTGTGTTGTGTTTSPSSTTPPPSTH
jgi:hypothetical protein